jgi:DNA gyrase inhibitor GyrI
MKPIVYISSTLLLLLAGGIAFLYYTGVFSEVSVKPEDKGPFHIAYLEYRGAYKGIGPTFERVEELMKGENITPDAYAGLYFDAPDKVEESKLRSQAGAIITETDYRNLEEKRSGELKLRIIPRSEFAFAQFPLKNFLSIIAGVYRVYPALQEYALSRRFPEFSYKETGYENHFIMEVYYSDRIEYLMRIPVK